MKVRPKGSQPSFSTVSANSSHTARLFSGCHRPFPAFALLHARCLVWPGMAGLTKKGISMQKKAVLLDRAQWAEKESVWQGEFQGSVFGANVSVMFYTTDEIGRGPRLHKHPYDEVFIVRQGRALFTVGEQQLEVRRVRSFSGRPTCRTNTSIWVRAVLR